ncbi:MAG: biotin--[acetyl-CoA-carboxylase] ligase [Myxococcota bacterium]|nr:biotin--[acetyl-CoA-carboxylase] ligase [Myxococcota bacterium]
MTEFSGPFLQRLLERDVRFHEVCESTQKEARIWADQGALTGSLVVANSQTAGRGRLGRSWHSAPGKNLAFSMVLRPPLRIQDAPLICLAAGVGLAEALNLSIKWPNDILDAEGRKIGGILAEMETHSGRLKHAVLGVGLNVNQTRFPESLPNPGSVAWLRGEQDRAVVLQQCVFAVEKWCSELVSSPGRVLAQWRKRSAHLGKTVRVGDVKGIAEGVREDGALLIRTQAGEVHPILAGDVEMVGQIVSKPSS